MSDANPPTQAKEDLREIKLRRPLAADFEALHALFHGSWMTTWAPHLPEEAVERFQTIDPVRQAMKERLDAYWLADLHDRIVGVIHVDGACLEDLHVAPERKGHGIGTYLLSEAERLGARTLDVRAFSDEAIRFYEHRGWIRVRSFMATEMGAPVQTHEYRAPGA